MSSDGRRLLKDDYRVDRLYFIGHTRSCYDLVKMLPSKDINKLHCFGPVTLVKTVFVWYKPPVMHYGCRVRFRHK